MYCTNFLRLCMKDVPGQISDGLCMMRNQLNEKQMIQIHSCSICIDTVCENSLDPVNCCLAVRKIKISLACSCMICVASSFTFSLQPRCNTCCAISIACKGCGRINKRQIIHSQSWQLSVCSLCMSLQVYIF